MFSLLFLLGIVVGITFAVFIFKESKSGLERHNETKRQKVEEAKERIMKMLAEKGKIANDDVEEALGVSHATAARYFDALEKEGKLRQIGTTGKHTYYEQI